MTTMRAVRAAILPAMLWVATTAAWAADGDLGGTSWQVQTIGGTALPDGVTASLAFSDDGRISGSSGCNRVVGGYEQDGATLAFGPAGTTMMACPDAQMRTQEAYVKVLEATRSFRAEDVRLILLDGNGDPLMTLVRDHDG